MRKWIVMPDTNFLLVPGQFGVDIVGELQRILDVNFEIAIPNVVLNELDLIERKVKGRDLMAVRMAKKLAEKFITLEIGRFGEKPIDQQILEFALNMPILLFPLPLAPTIAVNPREKGITIFLLPYDLKPFISSFST